MNLNSSGTRSDYLTHIDSMRAIAILFVVVVHTSGSFSWEGSSVVRNAILDLVCNATTLFVFISGYLFQHLSSKYRYTGYLVKKFKNVLVPYFIVSTPAVGFVVFWKNPSAKYSFLEGTSRAYQTAWFFFHGSYINYSLWYIPMICVYFLVSPLFIAVIRKPVLYLFLFVLIPVSLLAHRMRFPNPLIWHSVIYYLSAYVLGMFASQYREKIDPLIEKYLPLLLAGFAGYYFVHLFLSNHHGNYDVKHIFSFERGYVDWSYLQKLLLAFLLIGLLKKYDTYIARPLNYTCHSAFSIYLLHEYVIYGYHVLRWRQPQGTLASWMILSALVIIISLFLTKLTQKVFGANSRYLIGS